MEQQAGNKALVEARENGGSFYLLLNDDIKDYLKFDPAKEKLFIMFDKSKHGRFISLWKENQKPE